MSGTSLNLFGKKWEINFILWNYALCAVYEGWFKLMDQRDCCTKVLEGVVVSCKILVSVCQTTQHHFLEDYNLGLLCFVNIPMLVFSAFWPRKAKLLSEAQTCNKTCSMVKNDSYVLQYNKLGHVLLTLWVFIFKLTGFLVTFWVNLFMALI